jgi:hypothetical protein
MAFMSVWVANSGVRGSTIALAICSSCQGLVKRGIATHMLTWIAATLALWCL